MSRTHGSDGQGDARSVVSRRRVLGGAGALTAAALTGALPGARGLSAQLVEAASAPGPGPSIDVTAFGARGDGVTDDTAAIQAAIQSLTPLTGNGKIGGRLLMPPGQYMVSRPIILTYGVSLVGSGIGSTFIRQRSGANTSVITTGGTFPAYMSIANLTIDGNRDGNPRGLDGIGIDPHSGLAATLDFSYLFDVRIMNCGRHGVAFAGNAETKITKCIVTGCGGDGINASHQSDSTVTDVWMNGMSGNAVNLETCDQWTLTHLQLEGFANPSGFGIRISNCSAVRIASSSVAGMNGGVIADAGSRYVSLIGCHFESNSLGADGGHDSIRFDPRESFMTSLVVGNSTFTSEGQPSRVGAHIRILAPTSGELANCSIQGNTFEPTSWSEAAVVVPDPATGTLSDIIVGQNAGFATDLAGVAVLAANATQVVVDHGLSVAPLPQDIQVTPLTTLGRAGHFWISNPTKAGFTLNVDKPPGSGAVRFSWQASVRWRPRSWDSSHNSSNR